MSDNKKKLPKITFKKIKKSDNYITRQDQHTFYVKSSDPNKEPYFVYHEHINRDRWLCECDDFVFGLTDTGQRDCKHIKACKLL